MEKTFLILLAPGQKSENGQEKRTDVSDALIYIDLLRDNVTVDAKTVFGASSEQSKSF